MQYKNFSWQDWLADSMLSGVCCLCGTGTGTGSGGGFCGACLPCLPFNSKACRACAQQLHQEASICGACAVKPAAITRTIAVFRYAFPIDAMILKLKSSRNGMAMVPPLANLLASATVGKATMPDAVVAVPLHRKRLRSRGFNQSHEIARTLCRAWGVKLDSSLCSRVRDTKPQQGLGYRERGENMRGAFAVNGNQGYRHVTLVDDVITTGSTINSLAQAIMRTGVQRVDALCLAKAAQSK